MKALKRFFCIPHVGIPIPHVSCTCFQIRLSLDAFLRYSYLIMYPTCISHVSRMYLDYLCRYMYPSFIPHLSHM